MTKKLIEIASEIVQTQASLTPMTAADIADSLRQVFGRSGSDQDNNPVSTDSRQKIMPYQCLKAHFQP